MKIIIEHINTNLITALRRCGYHFEKNVSKTGEVSAVRDLGGAGGFPRFHAYAKLVGKNLQINLHLDQKRPVYRGTSAHAGEYDGGLIRQEAERIRALLSND